MWQVMALRAMRLNISVFCHVGAMIRHGSIMSGSNNKFKAVATAQGVELLEGMREKQAQDLTSARGYIMADHATNGPQQIIFNLQYHNDITRFKKDQAIKDGYYNIIAIVRSKVQIYKAMSHKNSDGSTVKMGKYLQTVRVIEKQIAL